MIWNSRISLLRATLLSCVLLTRMEVHASSEPALSTSIAEHSQSYSPSVPMELGDRSELLAQAQALYAEAIRIESTKGFTEALPEYEKVLTLDPSFSSLQWRLAFYCVQQNQPQQGLSIALRGLEANPKATSLRALSAWIYTILKQHREAIRVAKDALSQNFEEIYAYRALYESQKALGLDQDAKDLLKKASEIPSIKVKFWTDLAALYEKLLMDDSKVKKSDLKGPIAPLYEKALVLDPENSEIFKQYGDFLQRVDLEVLALAMYRKGLGYQSDDLELLLRIGRIELRKSNIPEAYRIFDQAYQLRPDFPMLRDILATLALQVGEKERALSLNEEIVSRNPKSDAAHRILLDLYGQLHRNDRAVGFYEKLVEGGALNDLVLDALDDLYQKEKRDDRAISFLEKLIQSNPKAVRPLMMLTSYYERLQLLEQKIVFFQNLITQNPKEAHFYSILTLIYQKMKRWDDAGRVYETMLSNEVGDDDLVGNYVLLLMSQKKFARSEEVLKAARVKFPDSIALGVLEGINLRQQKKYDLALGVFDEIQKTMSHEKTRELSIDFYLELGLTQELANKRDLAEKTFQTGLDRAPHDYRLQNALAYLWADQGIRLEEALSLSKKSLETRPKEGAYLDTLAWIYFKMGKYAEALPLLEQAKLSTQNDPEVLGHLAEIYEKMGRTEEAIGLWKSILEKNPDFTSAKEKMIALQEELKQSKAHVKSSP